MDKKELYNKAIEAYYSGEEIISDIEFDKLESDLRLNNKNLGSSHSQAYTIKHPYIMGSLSKVQIHDTHFRHYFKDIHRYINHKRAIITPKFDGCSFEIITRDSSIIQASTRGDGNYGKDILQLIKIVFKGIYLPLKGEYCLRGELLIKKSVFRDKYIQDYKNPRSFVSSLVNADWAPSLESRAEDIRPIIYDAALKTSKGWKEMEWPDLACNCHPTYYKVADINTSRDLKRIYEDFLEYRDNGCEYPLDGIVIKPLIEFRDKERREYPRDCVAIKFRPQVQETQITDIQWSLGKTGELIPTVIFDPIILDGKTITRASGSNYGNLINKGLYIGTKIVISLAGDIIPYIYQVKEVSSSQDLGDMPSGRIEGCHLYSTLSDTEANKNKLINSMLTLNIPNMGDKLGETLFNNLKWRNPEKPYNILCIKPHTLYKALGRGKIAENAREGFKQVLDNLTLEEIITSCNFASCGPKVAKQIAKQLLGKTPDYSHLPKKAYDWVNQEDSLELKELNYILSYLGKSIKDFDYAEMPKTGIPIIMTGSPNNYKTKADFLKANPQYYEATLSNAKILFTNSMESSSNKMKRAKSLGIDIQLY